MKESEIFLFLKNKGILERKIHRTISIVSQKSNITLKIVDERLKKKVG